MQSVVQRESGWSWVIANSIHVWSSSPRTDILGHCQPSLAGLVSVDNPTQDYVLGYSQSSPFDKLRAGSTGLIAICP